MKTRLFNEYGAAITDEGKEIYLIMNRALADVGAYCKENNIDLRDAQLFCMTDVNIFFCGEILRETIRLRKQKDLELKTNMTLKTPEDIPETWKRLTVRKKTTVRVRPAKVVEKFKVSWQDAELVSDPAVDLIIIQPDGKEYPCKRDIFKETYEWTDWNTLMVESIRQYRKKSTTTLVEIPEGTTVVIETLEGTLPAVSFPDFIAIGPRGELYANTREFFNNNLEVV